MRKTLYICCLLFLASCSESFLDKYPEDISTSKTFYKTEAHFTQALNGVYTTLRDFYGSDTKSYIFLEMRADNTHYSRYDADRGPIITEKIADFYLVTDQNTRIENLWRKPYEAISRANTVLDRIATAPEFSKGFSDQIIAEAKFLRAFYYFHLVQLFGGVPLQLHEVTSEADAFLPRATVDEVYTQIIADVTDAIKVLPTVTYNKDGQQTGHATLGAAKMLYAYVLMTKPVRDYVEAEKQLRDVMAMPYGLELNYADLFDPAKKNGKESIFEVQYLMGDYGLQNSVIYDFLPKSSNTSIATGVSNGNNILSGGWNVPTVEMINSYESGDLRRDASIAVVAGDFDKSRAMVYEKVLSLDDPDKANYPNVKAFVKKFLHPHNREFNTNDNWPVYRLADTYLLLAECLVEQGKGAEASQYVKLVRDRAGLTTTPSVITTDFLANERRHELAFESHRWYDLLRTGKAIEVMTAYGKSIRLEDPAIPEGAYNIKPEYLVYPIPYRELYTNKLLTPNPGYGS